MRKDIRIANNKLSYEIINKLMKPTITIIDQYGNNKELNNVTSAEFDFLFYLSLRQDSFGHITGVHYKEVMIELGYKSKQTFYNVLYGLEQKQYIQVNYQNKDSFWDILILDNIFCNRNDDQKGYYNTNRKFIYTPRFRALKVNEKKLCIKLSISYQSKHGYYIYPQTLAEWIGVSSSSIIYTYMENINYIFPNMRREGKQGALIYLSKGNNIPYVNTGKTTRENYLTHKIKYFCSTYKIAYTMKDLKDLIILIRQYGSKSKLYGTICDVLLNKKRIVPKLINSLLSSKNNEAHQHPGLNCSLYEATL